MAFSSVPLYLDPPNWQQEPAHQLHGVITSESHYNSQLPPPPQPASGSGDGSSIRPGSMSERARLAKIPQPETSLKCPRCDSTNTKFCYFNNYSLTQPRHFCKTCRRYWTRGGALRNVPVGGGCRRNKRNKGSNRSKTSSERQTGSASCSGHALGSNSCTDVILGHVNTSGAQQVPLLPPLHHLGEYDSGDIGLNFGGIQAATATGGGTNMDFQIEQWRTLQQVQQFPFLTSLEQTQTGLFRFESEGVVEPSSYGGHHQLRSKPLMDSAINQFTGIKMEDSQGLNLSRNFLGISGNDQLYLGASDGNSWTDLSGFIKEKSSHR